jgi:hypothetical protein
VPSAEEEISKSQWVVEGLIVGAKEVGVILLESKAMPEVAVDLAPW